MKKNIGRLLIALGVSSAGFLATVLWYQAGKTDRVASDRKPLARLEGASNEVQRKPIRRIIWENINKNDELYTGEAIRTAPDAEAQLFFIRTGTTIHLDPDSLIVLEESEHGLSLDFLKGNLFVQKSTEGGKEDLLLKAGRGQIKMNSAVDLSLSKGRNGNVSLEVHRGEAELNQGNKKTALNKTVSAEITDEDIHLAKDHLEVLHPSAGEQILLNMSRGQKLEVTWKPLPKIYRMDAEVGSSRGSLRAVKDTSASGDRGLMSFPARPGHWYLRLVAHAEGLPDVTSVTIPFSVDPKSPPSLLEPFDHANLERPPGQTPVAFKWINRDPYTAQVFEVSSDPTFKTVTVRRDLDGETLTASTPLTDGAYYWRVTGYLKIKGKLESLSSSPEAFQVVSHHDIDPPRLIFPVQNQRFSRAEVDKNGVSLRWEMPKDVTRVKVTLQIQQGETWLNQEEQTREVNLLHLTDLKSGHYRWTAESVNPEGGPAKKAELARFSIEDVPKIQWLKAAPVVDYEYRLLPNLRAGWVALAEPPSRYRYKVWDEAERPETSAWHFTEETSFEINLPHEGRFLAQVEALNSAGEMVGQSEPQVFRIQRHPLLPAPQWAQQTPDVLKGDGKGNLTFQWQEVEGAEHYVMVLESPDGQVIKKTPLQRTTASLNHLKPGAYQVYLKSVDGSQRESLDGFKKTIDVPKTSDIRAPKIRAMKVK